MPGWSYAEGLEHHLSQRGLAMPEGLTKLYRSDLPGRLGDRLLRPAGEGTPEVGTIEWAEAEIDQSRWPLLRNLVPIMAVDEQSFACVVASDRDGDPLPYAGRIVRWHVEIDYRHRDFQAGLLDIDCYLYCASVIEELEHRDAGLDLVFDVIGPSYESTYIERNERPRDHITRPVRLACQNVIVGLAAFAQESAFDGLSVVAWQTCERPHIASHEANRALAVVTLCAAFQNGGTMEIRFDRSSRVPVPKEHLEEVRRVVERWPQAVSFRQLRTDEAEVRHPERAVPASLKRYGRTIGVHLGGTDKTHEDYAAISPAQSRDLFRAITPMPDGLRARVHRAETELGISPERLCYMLLKPVWRDIELDYLLATTHRIKSILEGGADWKDRPARQAETEVCRGAVMVGMLYRRLNATDGAGSDGKVRVIEASTVGVQWQCLEELGSVRFTDMSPGTPVPWSTDRSAVLSDSLVVFPRALLTDDVLQAARASAEHEPTAVVVPSGIKLPDIPGGFLVLRCPDRLADLDKATEDKLLRARTSRG